MIIPSDFFTIEELKIRKRWLISMFVMLGFYTFQLAIMSLDVPHSLQFFASLSLFNLFVFGLLYYFSYKKHGYQMLQMVLLLPFTRLHDIIKSIQIQNKVDLVILLVILGLYGWWYYISFKFIELNRPLNPSRKCKKALAEMEASQTIEDLDLKFHNLVKEFAKFERVITKAYHEKKESLTLDVSFPAMLGK
ncbi:MAG: hypothetical protein JSS10_00630 [Verrucomicrobia bacterium]|nr:hypothetical protein [Verrucomicrobiota bacterium]